MENVFQNYEHQHFENKELIIILNKAEMDEYKWKERASRTTNVSIYRLKEAVTLGACLNFGIKKAKFEYIAKFDDDDYYSPYYLMEAMNTFDITGASIVGKSSIFIYFESIRGLALYNPDCEHKFTHLEKVKSNQVIIGATLVFKKEIGEIVKFPEINLGEDTEFQRKCIEKGLTIYSTSKYNYTYIRYQYTPHHTSRSSEKRLLKKSEFVVTTGNFKQLVTKKC